MTETAAENAKHTRNQIFMAGAIVSLSLWQILSTELSFDEAYYFLFSKYLAWGYFDHPPMAPLFIRLGTLLSQSEFGVRIIGLIATTLMLYMVSHLIARERRFWLWLLFSISPLLASAGFLAVPDTALVVFGGFFLVALEGYLAKDGFKESFILALCTAGVLYSKYHGVLLIGFVVLANISLLKTKSFWGVVLTSLILFLPHLFWQYFNDFITLKFHFYQRDGNYHVKAKYLAEFWGTQLILPALLLGPMLWWQLFKTKSKDAFDRSLKFIVIGTVVFFAYAVFSKRVQGNWTVGACLPLLVFVLRNADGHFFRSKLNQSLIVLSVLISLTARAMLSAPEFFRWVPARVHEFHGWDMWAKEISTEAAGCPLVANNYQLAAKLSFYTGQSVPSLNIRSRPNQFDIWKFEYKLPSKVCFVSDLVEFRQQKHLTPDGEEVYLAKDVVLEELLKYRLR